ncbi:hypothetical protein [Novipirellula caenicola]|uniref:Fe2OG dioxygenase domain-containing protein n=1 Tax=Novipirellula caenicola TaxID=1536901 RepID=A0ABP9W3F1_9BACT
MIKVFENFKYDKQNVRINGYTPRDISDIRQQISNELVVVLKGVFAKEDLQRVRENTVSYIAENPPTNPMIEAGVTNFWRRDDNPAKSAVKRVKQFFASFYWNDDLAGESDMMKAMSVLRNEIAGLPATYTIAGMEPDGFMTYGNVTHYPSGGGKLNKHQDPPNKQFAVIIASMSKKGSDFEQGGFYVEMDGNKLDIDQHLDVGDVYLMNPNCVHGVDAIDPQKTLDWDSGSGRWILFPALIEVKTVLGQKVEGLRDLEQ